MSTGALVDAMGRALDAVTAKDTRGFFGHCGCQESAYFVKVNRGIFSEVRRSAWYDKRLPTFADALALVRKELWEQTTFAGRSGRARR